MATQADPAQHYEQPLGHFPARGDHDERWPALGRAIAASTAAGSAVTPAIRRLSHIPPNPAS